MNNAKTKDNDNHDINNSKIKQQWQDNDANKSNKEILKVKVKEKWG